MEAKQVKKLAAKVFKVGTDRVKVMDTERASEAITRDDIRQLVKEKAVVIKPKTGASRGRARVLKAQKKKGRRAGKGKRKGTKKTRQNQKKLWMTKVRSQRKKLKEIRPKGYRGFYKRIKAGFYRNIKHLEAAIKGE